MLVRARKQDEGAEQRHEGDDDADRDEERPDEEAPHDVVVVLQVHEEAHHEGELDRGHDEERRHENDVGDAGHVEGRDLDGGARRTVSV